MIGHTIHEYSSVSSTNDVARSGAVQGAEEGSVYMAYHQTSGRGRRGAVWNDEWGQNVLMTVVLYPQMPMADLWQLGWAACVAVVDTLSAYGVNAKCKWPNDVVVDGCKIAGVLIETTRTDADRNAAFVGIGVNVNQLSFSSSLAYSTAPTSLRIVTGNENISVRDVVEKLCASLDLVYAKGSVLWPEVAEWYRVNQLIGILQTGISVETGYKITGDIQGVRDSDGAALIKNSESESVLVLPDTNVQDRSN